MDAKDLNLRISHRTYPQPDLGHLSPRHRALNLFKYLLGMEPEEAVKHRTFPLVRASYESAEERGANELADTPATRVIIPDLRTDKDSLVDMLETGGTLRFRNET